MRWTSLALVVALAAVATTPAKKASAQTVDALDPHVKATAQSSPPKISLTWNTSSDVTGWVVRRREGTTGAFMPLGATLPPATTTYEDSTVEKGKTYEYQVQRQGTTSSGASFTLAGIEVPFIDDPGVVALVVDQSMGSLSQLARLQDDLVAEGWEVERVDVDPASKPAEVRAKLQELRTKHKERLRAAFLLGGVPRAFSGLLNPDGHPDHLGAWPADGYYGDLDGTWTDDKDLGGAGTHINNKGDGKFDGNTIPSDLELAIGRVDTVGMPAFAPATPSDLLARYLDADHAYRTAQLAIKERAFVSDNFGYFSGEAFARIAWRDGWSLYGADPVTGKPFFDALEEEGGYGFAIGCGPGTPTGAGGVGSTTDFVNRKPQAVFLGLFGSYFGDWSFDDDLLRASILSKGTALATAWFARPWHHFHHLGALKTFGESFFTMVNAKGYDSGVAANARSVHLALLGDPTLRMFVARAPTGLSATPAAGSVQLAWTASPDASVGYHVYRRAKSGGPAARLTAAPIAATSYTDDTATDASAYRVVAVRLRTTGSGTFFEHSPGPIAEAAPLSAAAPDGGVDDAGDAGDTPAADPVGESKSGCGCRVTPRENTSAWALVLGTLLLRRRRVS
ncbi:MAG: MYXO-CTERM sorting domain-containing protein [Polyangiales bacterium]